MYTIGQAITTAYTRYGPWWFSRVTIIWDPKDGYLINIAHGPHIEA